MDANKEKNPNVLLNKYADKMSETVLNFIESNDIMDRKFTIDRKNDDFFLEYGLANFTIKEIPDWLFGIQWIKGSKNKNSYIFYSGNEEYIFEGTLFTEYKMLIDKFKPIQTEIKVNIIFRIEDGDIDDISNDRVLQANFESKENVEKIINFIYEEPYLAFYKTMTCIDYNYKHVSRKKAKEFFNKFQKRRYKEMSEYRIAKNIMDGFVKEKILPYIKNSKIIDNGPDISPRYEIEAPFNDNDNIPGVPRPGHYYIDLFTPNGAIRSFSEQIRLIEMKCSSVSENFDSEIDHFVWLH